jgi:hypothetical protein
MKRNITFMVTSRWILLRMRNVSEKYHRENQNTHIMFNFLFPKIMLFMRYCGKCGRARQATDGNIVWRMRLACWKNKATDRHSEYEIRVAFLLHQWLHKHASFLRYIFISCLVSYTVWIFISFQCLVMQSRKTIIIHKNLKKSLYFVHQAFEIMNLWIILVRLRRL